MASDKPWEDFQDNSPPDYFGRGRYFGQLTDPAVRDRLIAYTQAEVGGQGRDSQLGFIESSFNRGVARDQHLANVLSGSYFPHITHSRASRPVTQAMRDYYNPIIDEALYGSNITNFATGNASGSVGFAGGPLTARLGGEKYGIEGPDRGWYQRVGGGPPPGPWNAYSSSAGGLPSSDDATIGSGAAPSRFGGVATQRGPWDDYSVDGGVSEGQPTASASASAASVEPGPWQDYADQPEADAEIAPKPTAVAESPGLLGYGKEFLKQMGIGAVESGVAAPLRGASPSSPETRGLQSAIEAIQAGADIDQAVQATPAAPEQLSTTAPYRAGEAVSQATEGFLQPSGVLNPVVQDIARGLGSVAGSIVSSPVGGPILAGRGEAVQTAVQAGATPEQQEAAGRLGSGAGVTDYADLLLATTGGTGKALGLIAKVGQRALIGALTEGGQEGLQQFIQNAISKGVYKPDQDLMKDVPYNAFIGAVVGGGISSVMPNHGEASAVKPVTSPPTAESLAAFVPKPTASPEGYKLPSAVDEEAALERRAYEPLKPDVPAPVFYSKLLQTAQEKLPESGSAQQVMATLKNAPGVKQEEIEDTGLEQWISQQEEKIAKKDVIEYLEENAIRVETVTNTSLGTNDSIYPVDNGGVRYDWARAPGPVTEYGELRLVVPPRNSAEAEEAFRGAHWDEPNVVAHIRYTSRVDKAGNAVLHVEEFQSDWAQQVRESGSLTRDEMAELANLRTEYTSKVAERDALSKKLQDSTKIRDSVRKVADRAQDPSVAQNLFSELGRLAAAHNELETQYRTLTDDLQDNRRRRSTILYGEPTGQRRDKKLPKPYFQSSWVDLSIKRMFRWAADNGYSKISWQSPELAALYNTGAQGDIAQVQPKTLQGLQEFYGKIVPSRMKAIAKKFGGVLGETRIDVSNVEGPHTYSVEQATSFEGEDSPWTVWRIPPEGGHGVLMDTFGSEREARAYARDQQYVENVAFENIAKQGGTASVFHVTVPKAAQTAIQQGLTLYQKPLGPDSRATRIVVTPQVRASTGPEFNNAVKKMAKIFDDFAKRFGFDSRVTIQIQTGVLDPSEPTAIGLATGYGNGTYLVQLNADAFKGNIADLYSTMMHELGHVVMWDVFNKLPDHQKNLIRADYDSWKRNTIKAKTVGNMLSTRQSAVTTWQRIVDNPGAKWIRPIRNLTKSQRDYHLSFDEWFADQVAKWGTTSEPAITVAETYYSKIGKALRYFLEYVARQLNIDARPTLLMNNWLNSVAFGLGPMSAQVYSAADIRTQKDNQYYVQRVSGDPDVDGVPQQPETTPVINAIQQVFNGNPPVEIKEMAAHADRMNWLYKWTAGLLEVRDANPNLPSLQEYVNLNQQKDQDESQVQDAATKIAKDWRSLGVQSDNLVQFLDELTNMSYLTDDERKKGVVRQPTQQEVSALAQRVGLNAEGAKVGGRVKQFFDTILQLVKKNAIDEAMKITDPVERAKAVDQINGEIRALQQRPYFPFMRFGRHYVTVRDADGKVIHFETFERKGLQSAERRQAQKANELRQIHGNSAVQMGLLPETTEPFIGLPPTLLRHIQRKLDLTPSQLDAMEQLQFQLSPALSFKHHFQHKNFTAGYSKDFMRAFARYAFSAGRYMSKVKYVDQMRGAIQKTRNIGVLEDKVADYMADHFENNILNVKSDYGIAKGFIFLQALGFSPAAATQNLFQTPTVTLPYLGSIFGSLQSGRALARAMTQIANFQKKGSYPANNTPSQWEMRAIEYGIRKGHISETQAAELAGLAQGGNLIFGAANSPTHRMANWVMEKSSWMFEMAEQFNRRAAFRAALELASGSPNNQKVKDIANRNPGRINELVKTEGFTPAQAQAISFALDAVDATQFVYKRYARPRFMRGRIAGTVFVFHRYIQSLIYLGINNPSVLWRYMLVAGLLGGMGGLPGYDDLKELIQGVMKRLGYDFDIENEVRKYVKDHTNGAIPADLILHGLARRGFGIPALLDALGSMYTGRPGRAFSSLADGGGPTPGQNIPFPQIDMSKSISPGPILPVTGKLLDPTLSWDKAISDQVQKASGATFSAFANMTRAIMDNQLAVNDPKRWERAMPRALASLSKSYRSYSEGRERFGPQNSGSTIINYDVRDTEQMMEVFAQALGYNNLRSSGKWDYIIAERDHEKWIDFNKSALLKQFQEAHASGYPAEREKVLEKIKAFNDGLSDADKPNKITGDTIRQSLQGQQRERRSRETGIPVQRKDVPAARQLQGLFPEATIDVRRR